MFASWLRRTFRPGRVVGFRAGGKAARAVMVLVVRARRAGIRAIAGRPGIGAGRAGTGAGRAGIRAGRAGIRAVDC